MTKVNRTIRFDAEILKIADKAGIDVNEICRDALNKQVNVHDISRQNVSTALKLGWITLSQALEMMKNLDDDTTSQDNQ